MRSVCILFCLATSLSASTLSLVADLDNGLANTNVFLNGATTADSLTDSQSVSFPGGGRTSNGAYRLRAEFGNLGLAFSSAATCFDLGCGSESVDIMINVVSSQDFLTISGATSGFLKLDVLMEGNIAANGNADATVDYSLSIDGATDLSLGVDKAACCLMPVTNFFSEWPSNFEPAALEFNSDTLSWSYAEKGSIFLPFSGGEIGILQSLGGLGDCIADPERSCSSASDFLHTATVGGAQVYDSNLNLIPGAFITSDSGYDYTKAISEMPEPTSWALGLGGLAVLVWRRRMLA